MTRTAKRIGLYAVAALVSCGGQAVDGGGQTGGTGGGGTGGTGGTGGYTGPNIDGGTGGLMPYAGAGGWGNAGGVPSCTNTEFSGLDPTVAGNTFFTAVYGVGDGDSNGSYPSDRTDPGSTFCLDSPFDGEVCMNGLGREACAGTNPCDYHRWGTMMGFDLGVRSDNGTIAPFDADAAGVTGVRFTLSGVTSPIRVQITMPDDPATTDVNEGSGFVYGGGTNDPAADGTITAQFSQFKQPSWGYPSLRRDTKNIAALQFQLPTVAGMTTPYDFCVSGIQLVDASGTAIAPPPNGSAGAGGASSAGAGGMSGGGFGGL